MISCPFCEVIRNSVFEFIVHVKLKHKDNMKTEVTCRHLNCGKMLQGIHAYKKHYLKKHYIDTNSAVKQYPREVSENSEAVDFYEDKELHTKVVQNIGTEFLTKTHLLQDISVFTENVYTHVSLIVAKIYAQPSLPRKTADDIMDVLIDFYNSSFIRYFLSHCSGGDVDVRAKIINNAFAAMKSEHLAFKYYQEKGTLIMPKTITLEYVHGCRILNAETVPVITRDTSEFISAKCVLEKFLEQPRVLQKIFDNITNCKNSTRYDSIFQNNLYKLIESRYKGKCMIPLFLYNDNFEINNPLGSRKVRNKIGAVYYSLGGEPSEYASQLQNIFLYQLHKYVDHRDKGNEIIYANIIRELCSLQEDGIPILFEKDIIRVYFPLYAILGDNLGLNTNLGFSKGSNANNPCRICNAPKQVIHYSTVEDEKYLRSASTYKSGCRDKQNGLVEECVFHAIPYYNVFEHGVLDPMHDLNEGVCRYSIGFILNTIIFKEKLLSLNFLNSRISSFNYVRDDNSVPTLTEKQIKDDNLIISSSEMTFLIENLGLLIGDRIPKANKAWNLYALLREIMCIVYGDFFDETVYETLEKTISKHHTLYMKLSGKHLTLKFHNTEHLPRFIKQMGPPKYFSCIRFEGRHRWFKQYANAMTSRVNPPHSLALKNQLMLSYRLLINDGFKDKIVVGKSICNADFDKFNQVITKNGLKNNTFVTSVRVKGTLYKEKYVICLNAHPIEFGIIRFISVENNDIHLLFHKLSVRSYEKRLSAYCIEETKEVGIINQNVLKVFLPIVINNSTDGRKYVATRIQ